ncbi:MAG: ABC transporter permease, partial [Alphaproteobacteria bacterium]|nr:ABC transporter permease [Alphaproteobacteria bacterium]
MAEATAIVAAERLAPRRRLRTLRKLVRHRSFLIGGAIVLLLVFAALAAPWLTKFDPLAMRVRIRFRPPQWDYPFGTDRFGRDIFTRVLYGAQISLWIGLGTTLLSGFVGAAIGVIAAQFRRLDAPLMRVMDALMAFPAILLAIGLAAALGTGITNLIIALAVAYMPRTARLVRASALVVRELEFVDAARVAGAGHLRIMLQHLLPNCM